MFFWIIEYFNFILQILHMLFLYGSSRTLGCNISDHISCNYTPIFNHKPSKNISRAFCLANMQNSDSPHASLDQRISANLALVFFWHLVHFSFGFWNFGLAFGNFFLLIFAPLKSKLREVKIFHNEQNISQQTKYFTTYKIFHNERNISQRMKYLTTNEIFHNERNISQWTKYFTMNEIFNNEPNISQRTKYFTTN